MAKRIFDVKSLIGSTPLVKLRGGSDQDLSSIFAKLEFYNPGGSVKDRIALSMIEDAEARGLIKPGDTIVEPTSGNTGIGLAIIGALKGYRVIIVMSDSMGCERRRVIESYGGEIVLSPCKKGMLGSIEIAEELVSKNPNYYMPQQFNNLANPEIHRRTTGKEILRDMTGMEIHAFVAGVGTGGTITGAGEVIKGKFPDAKIVAVEPSASALLSGGRPGNHLIQGIGAGFIPKVLNVQILDEIIPISDDEAYESMNRLSREESLLVGISSGAAYAAALRVAKSLGKKKNIVVIFPDSGERYFSFQKFFNF